MVSEPLGFCSCSPSTLGSKAVPDLLEPGQVFAERYRVERYLAEGGMGAVFVAEQLATERKVALKVLWPQRKLSQKTIDQFQLEARVAARVESEHIVQILDAGQDERSQMLFLVMELLKGQSLQSFVDQQGPLAPDAALLLLSQVASGLDKAHGYTAPDGTVKPILHRDLKPENLFLTHRESGQPHVKILDFGLAKVLSETASLSGEVKGTPIYMAVEQVTGARPTPQTDVWALGLIAFFLLTGRAYWASANREDATVEALYAEILSLPMVPASTRLSDIGCKVALPVGFDEWLQRCIARNPAQRFTGAGAAIESLAELVAGRAPRKAASLSIGLAATERAEPPHVPPLEVGSSQAAMSNTFSPPATPTTRSTWLPVLGGAALALGGGLFFLASSHAPSSPAAAAPASVQVVATAASVAAPLASAPPSPVVPSAAVPSSTLPAPAKAAAPLRAPIKKDPYAGR